MPSTNHELSPLVDIDFDRFRLYTSNPQTSFEALSYFLFCRRFKITAGLFRYKNQAGIETNPVRRRNKVIGFQAKFFESSIDKNQLIDSLEKARAKHPDLTNLIFYISKEFSERRSKGETQEPSSLSSNQKAVEDRAKKLGIKIDWVVPSNFEIELNRPVNLDLAQYYFGAGDQVGFIKHGANPRIQTFLQSNEYINLPLSESDDNTIIEEVAEYILRRDSQKNFLVVGHPGSGKSIFVHSLFREYGGLDKTTEEEMIQVLIRNQAVPMIVNLKDCITETLENLIRLRKDDSRVREQKLGFIYLFDGLDELSEELADQVISFIKKLEQSPDTIKIVISCRSGSINRLKVGRYIDQIIELKFNNLDYTYIDKFFLLKSDRKKIRLLHQLQKSNRRILNDIKDILSISLLWDTIETLSDHSTVSDLIERKVELLLNKSDYKKNLDSLNLLDNKSDKIIALNQEISFRFQQKYQYRFSQKELQDIILEKFPRMDYKSINLLLHYISNMFFENTYSDNDTDSGFIYQHRRYQEFFFTQKLKDKYEEDPTIVRKLDVLSNREYFEEYFLPYLRKEYERQENIIGLIDLNLIAVYLSYSIEQAYYLGSQEFILSLVKQPRYFIEEIMNSENFQVEKILFVDIVEIKEQFILWQKYQEEPIRIEYYKADRYLSKVWESKLVSILKNIILFWKEGADTFAKKLLKNFEEAMAIYAKNKYTEQREQSPYNLHPHWSQFESYLFLRICIKREDPSDIFRELIRANYSQMQEHNGRIPHHREDGKEKLVKSFFRVVLEYQSSFFDNIINDFDEYELLAFLDILRLPQFIKMFVTSRELQAKVKSLLQSRNIKFSDDHFYIAFYKKFLDIAFNEVEHASLMQVNKKSRQIRRDDWLFYKTPEKFAFVSYGLSTNNFDSINAMRQGYSHDYDELALYSALFDSLISILTRRKTIGNTVRNYIAYIKTHNKRLAPRLEADISRLWAQMIGASDNLPVDDILPLKYILLQAGTNVISYSFFSQLADVNRTLFDNLVNESDLLGLEDQLQKTVEHQSIVNKCFSLSLFFLHLNEQKSKQYFVKGLKESIVRHDWHKDTIVSYSLVDSLKILWESNCDTKKNLTKLTREVYDLTLRVYEFTDGDHTSEGPSNLIEAIAKYDIELAEILWKDLREKAISHYVKNAAITGILLGKVRLGFSIEEIEKEIREYQRWRTDFDVYEEEFTIYIAITESDLYEDIEKNKAANKAYDLVDELREKDVLYHFRSPELQLRYLSLCEKYEKKNNWQIDKSGEVLNLPPFSEEQFVESITNYDTKRKIINLYKRIENYELNIVLTQKESWQVLLTQTYKVLQNIEPFLELLRIHSFPSTTWYMTANSEYFHFGLAIALSDLQMKYEAINYLYRNTGHGGFYHMITVYKDIGDKQMCQKLFARYLQLCHLLCD